MIKQTVSKVESWTALLYESQLTVRCSWSGWKRIRMGTWSRNLDLSNFKYHYLHNLKVGLAVIPSFEKRWSRQGPWMITAIYQSYSGNLSFRLDSNQKDPFQSMMQYPLLRWYKRNCTRVWQVYRNILSQQQRILGTSVSSQSFLLRPMPTS